MHRTIIIEQLKKLLFRTRTTGAKKTTVEIGFNGENHTFDLTDRKLVDTQVRQAIYDVTNNKKKTVSFLICNKDFEFTFM